jgi:hypothetical protein
VCLVVVFANIEVQAESFTSAAYLITISKSNPTSQSKLPHHEREVEHNTMSLLRPSIAGRLLRAGAPYSLRAVPSTKRYDTNTAAGTQLTSSTPLEGGMTVQEKGKGKEDLVKHNQPDYTAEVDQASSYV